MVTPRVRQKLIDVLQIVSDSTEIPEKKVSVIAFQGSQSSVLCAGNCRTAAAEADTTSGTASNNAFDKVRGIS